MTQAVLRSSILGGIRPEALKRAFDELEQPCKQTSDGVVLFPRPERTGWLTYGILAERGTEPSAFSDLYAGLDPRVDKRLRSNAVQAITLKAAVRRWLETGDFGQLAYKSLEMPSPDARHLWLRDIVLPEFFSKYPNGKLAYLSYASPVRRYLHLLNVFQRCQILQTTEPHTLAKYLGRDPMAAYGLSVPAELLWMMLSFASLMTFPEAYAFAASCEHQFFIYFIADRPVRIAKDEEDSHLPMDRIMPIMRKAFDEDRAYSATLAGEATLRPKLSYPFCRRQYNAASISEFLSAYVKNLDGFLHWLSEACNFVDDAGEYALTFALQTYHTVHVLLNTTFRFLAEQQDMFLRKMQFFDVLELYAALADCRKGQTDAWEYHLTDEFHNRLLDILRCYPAPFCEDFATATAAIFEGNNDEIERGLIYGREADGSIRVPKIKEGMTLNEFRPRLLRALRNTKHGLAIKSAQFLDIHTGATSNDLPDYAIGLWLSLVSNQAFYALSR